ncbi:MAG: hypothetical protein C0424_12670 [Sphingobacteriaceae bacterium]|nr:hypothetical protein [Sphingobacteriaceae bacterium]
MKQLYLLCLFVVLLAACKKSTTPANPFDDPKNKPPVSNNNDTLLPLDNFAGLHQRIFKPTCSNSGCHDGTFEPDFRTIESSYATMVNQPIIKNNPAGAFQLRVVPGNANASVLHERVVRDIDGISGIMPLSVDPNSDWPARKTEYIAAIVAWINAGARDMFGNPPTNGPSNPRIGGWQLVGRQLLLSFQSEAAQHVVLVQPSSQASFKLPTYRLEAEKTGTNVFGEPVKYTHAVDVRGLGKGNYQLLYNGLQLPADHHLKEAYALQIR